MEDIVSVLIDNAPDTIDMLSVALDTIYRCHAPLH